MVESVVNPFQYPFVSVIVPVFNGQDFLESCLNSLENQRYPNHRYEIILIDNGSTDATAAIAGRHQVTYCYFDQRRTPAASRNEGIRQARGEILVFTDADCAAPATFLLEHVLSHWELHENTGPSRPCAVAGGIRGINKNPWAVADDICSWFLFHYRLAGNLKRRHASAANLSLGTSAVKDLGGFNSDFRYWEDVELIRRLLAAQGRLYFRPWIFTNHLNRATYHGFKEHRTSWMAYHQVLLEKEFLVPQKHTLFTMLFRFLVARPMGIVAHIMRSRRVGAVFLFPLVYLGQVLEMTSLIQAELRYKRRHPGEA